MKDWHREFIWILAISFLIWIIYKIRSILFLFLITGVLAYIFDPFVSKLASKLRLKKGLAIGILYILIITPIVVFLAIGLPILASQLMSLAKNIPGYYNFISDMIDKWQASVQTNPVLQNAVKTFLSSLQPRIEGLVSDIVNRIFNFIITLTASIFTFILAIALNFYFLIDLDNIKRWFANILPANIRNKTLNALEEVNISFRSFLKAQAILCLYVGISDGIGAYIFGIDYAFTLGVIAAFTELIPYLGPFLGGIPAIIIAVIISPWKALEIAIWYTVVQELEAHIVVPKVMEKEMGLHPLIVIFSILAFGKLFGLWGVLFAVPLAAIIKIVIKIYFPHIWERGGINGER
jgi:predicted PurR-regulated permease PerM